MPGNVSDFSNRHFNPLEGSLSQLYPPTIGVSTPKREIALEEMWEVDRFEAESVDGEKFTVVKYQKITKNRNLDGSMSIDSGRSPVLFCLSDGRRVNFIYSETFQIVDTDQIIREVG